MNIRWNLVSSVTVVALSAAVLASGDLARAETSSVTADDACATRHDAVDRRVAQEAARGASSFHRFVELTKPAYQLDMKSALEQRDAGRVSEKACAERTALASPGSDR